MKNCLIHVSSRPLFRDESGIEELLRVLGEIREEVKGSIVEGEKADVSFYLNFFLQRHRY